MKVNVQIEKVVKLKLEKLNKPETKTQIHQVLADMCNPYVPYNTGQLANSVQVGYEGIRYSAVKDGHQYAAEAYNGSGMQFRTDQHPLASAKWDKAMLRDHRDEFNRKVKDILSEALNG